MFLHPPLGPQLDQLPGLSHHIVYTWNRQLPATSHHAHRCTVCESFFYILCTEQSLPVLLSHRHHRATFQSLQSTTHHFRLSCIHLQSFAKQAISPISHPSAKLLHCWCHNYQVISIQQLGRQTTSRLARNNIHDSSKQQWTQYWPLMQTNLHLKTFT